MTEKNECCGCSACYSICPRRCITMRADAEGFLYPEINKANCIQCGLCEKVCPENNKYEISHNQKCYVVRARDTNILYNSTSGGFFTPLAEYILQQNGVVCGAGYSRQFDIEHQIIFNKAELNGLRGSKYVQSDLKDCFLKIREFLKQERLVLFCGTPCQIQGLKKFLQINNMKKLITVDMVCKGVASPKLWKSYLDYQENVHQSQVCNINFRKKNRGYHSPDMELKFINGDIYSKSGTDYFMRCYTKEICSRPSCYHCSFKGMERCSDFTIFDAWSMEKIVGNLKDDDRGYTNLIIHSDKGKKLFQQIQDKYYIHSVDIKRAALYDGIMITHQPAVHKRRMEFFQILNKDGLEKSISMCIPVLWQEKVKERAKGFLYRLGLLQICKGLIRRGKASKRRE